MRRIVAVILAVIAVSCSSPSRPPSSPTVAVPPVVEDSATLDVPASPTFPAYLTESPETASRCEAAVQDLIAAISQGLEGKGATGLRNVFAVRSHDYSKVWMVSGDLDGPGLEKPTDIATWATNDASGDGSIYSVDAHAKEFSSWGDGGGKFSLSDDGVAESQRCAER